LREVSHMTTVTVDDRKRVRLPDAKPGQVLAIQDNGDGSVTLRPVNKADAKERFPRGSLRKLVDEMNREWKGVKLPVPSVSDLPD
jgi:hypothetical protein